MISPRLVEALRNMCWCGRDSCDACPLAMVDWLDFVRYKPSAFDKDLAPPRKWVIIKASRNYLDGLSYDGPTRRRVGAPKVMYFAHKPNADFYAELMSKHNPVGFRVVPYRPIKK